MLRSNNKISVKEYHKNVYSKPGQILKMHTMKQIYSMFEKKKPKTYRKYVGVEIEFCAKIDKVELGKKLLKQGILNYIEWHRDDSLRPIDSETGHEICVLAPEGRVLSVLRKICKVLKDIDAKTKDRRCGLHVHLDCRKRNRDVLYNNLVACQKWFMLMSDPKRRNGEFCKKVNSKIFPKNFKGDRFERYKTVNAASYFRHKTIEVRTHEGTINVDDIVNWVSLLTKVANHEGIIRNSFQSIRKMKETIGLNDKMENYIRDRVNYWKINGSSSPVYRAIPQPDVTMTARSSEVMVDNE